MRKARILVAGEICREITVSGVTGLENDTASAEEMTYGLGGAGMLTSAILSFYGSDVVLCSKVGRDGDGRAIQKYLSSGGFKADTRFVASSEDVKTSVHLKINTPEGKKTVICRDKKYGIGREEIDDAFISYPDAAVLLDCINPWGYRQAAQQSAANGSRLFIMTSPDTATLHHFEKCEVLSLTEDEAVAMTGLRLNDQENCMRACMALDKHIKSEFTVLRLGDRGYFISDGTFYTFVPAYELPACDRKDCDTMFVSAFLHSFIDCECGVKEACEFASAAVAVYVTRGESEIPTENDVEAFIARNR